MGLPQEGMGNGRKEHDQKNLTPGSGCFDSGLCSSSRVGVISMAGSGTSAQRGKLALRYRPTCCASGQGDQINVTFSIELKEHIERSWMRLLDSLLDNPISKSKI
jgi:hypothetical protein